MSRVIRISKQGLSQCPSCQAHIRVASNITDTTCPFCETELVTAPPSNGGLLSGRGAKVAIALFGAATIIGACASQPPAPAYGIPPTEQVEEQTKPDASTPETVVADEPLPSPKYGAPPAP
jgi:hypothetical protein